MKTLKEIVREVQAVRPLSGRQIQRHIKAAGIRPAGARQRPQQFPDDSAAALIAYLGFGPAKSQEWGKMFEGAVRIDTTPAPSARVLSLPEIKRAARAKKGGAK